MIQPIKGIPPSIARIIAMPTKLILEHNALISIKKSSLSSTQRKVVQFRVKYLLDKELITQEEVDLSLKKIKEI